MAAKAPEKYRRSHARNLERKYRRHAATQARVEQWRVKSPFEQMRDLDSRLGPGVGATRQRARIAATMVPWIEAAKPE